MRKKVSATSHRPVRVDVKPIVIRSDGTIAPEEFTEEELEFFQGWQPSTKVTRKDIEESVRVRHLIRAVPKQCFFNAKRVVQKLDAYAADSYVEGIACLGSGLLIEHGWVCRPDGTIMDPTLPTHEGVYFPGLEFRGRTGICEFLATPRGRKCKSLFQKPYAVVRLRGRLYRNRSRYFAPVSRRSIN